MAGESDDVIMTKRQSRTVAVFGAYGHTGRFVAAELHRRGIAAILSGRDRVKLDLLGEFIRIRTYVSLPSKIRRHSIALWMAQRS